jgi:3-methyladenine DNA glycosylase AlkD
MSLNNLKRDIKQLADPKQAILLQRFFKTGKGEYGEGDIFLGIKVPVQRSVAKKYKDLSLADIQQLLNSKIHEYRLIALLILMQKYDTAEEDVKKQIFEMYLMNTQNINNWDLIDLSAPNIVGNYLLDKDRSILYKLAKSKSIWDKRISMLATFEFIANGQVKDTLAIAEILVNDKHDLIQKAVGWMLRELGKRVSQGKEEKFLRKYYKTMPRIMLRYSIERFDDKKKEFYMNKVKAKIK